MRIKTIIKGLLIIGMLIGVSASGWFLCHLFHQRISSKNIIKESESLWISNTPVPKTINPGAYLSALNAVLEEDLQTAADYYMDVMEGDSENEKIQKEAYFINAILGNFEKLRDVTNKLDRKENAALYINYIKTAYAIKDNNWDLALQTLANRDSISMDSFVVPLLYAWIYAGQNKYDEAMTVLESLEQEERFKSYYYYHKGLISMMMGKDSQANEAFQKLSERKMITFSFYPEIRAFYVARGNWGFENPFYLKWQLFSAEQPATAELLMLFPYKPITIERGVAEVFYNLSTSIMISEAQFETPLMMSALSMYLNPKQELPNIWCAEILEEVKKPKYAYHFYKKIKKPLSQTLEYKKAANLLACGKEKEALKILNQLKPSNQKSIHLWMSLADIYIKEKNWSEAVKAYSRVLEIVGESNKQYASEVYFLRAVAKTEQNELDSAENDLHKAIELNGNNPLILNHLGYMMLEREKQIDKAFSLIQKAHALNPNDAHIIDSMAYAFYKKGEFNKALPLAELAVDRMPQSSVSNMHLGEIYESIGRIREANYQYQKALSLKYDMTPELKKKILAKIGQK